MPAPPKETFMKSAVIMGKMAIPAAIMKGLLLPILEVQLSDMFPTSIPMKTSKRRAADEIAAATEELSIMLFVRNSTKYVDMKPYDAP